MKQCLIGDTTLYTPTITGAGTCLNVCGATNRNGNIQSVRGDFNSGTCTAISLKISIPCGIEPHYSAQGDRAGFIFDKDGKYVCELYLNGNELTTKETAHQVLNNQTYYQFITTIGLTEKIPGVCSVCLNNMIVDTVYYTNTLDESTKSYTYRCPTCTRIMW